MNTQVDKQDSRPSKRDALGLTAALSGAALALSPIAAQANQAAPVGGRRNRTGLTLEDCAAIHDLLARYAWYLDTHQGKAWADLFAPGGKAIFTQSSATTREELERYPVPGPGASPPELRQHHVANILIDGDAGGQSCTVRSYMTATFFSRAGNLSAFLATGWYKDRCVKIGGEWYFMERRFLHWGAALD